MSDDYLRHILTREAVDYSTNSPLLGVQRTLMPIIQQFAGTQLASMFPSGSYAKRTANRSGTDIDLFISLKADTNNSLSEIYEILFKQMAGYSPKRQNVSINVKVNGYDVDLVPGKLQNPNSTEHSLYRRRVNSWTKTDVSRHVAVVQGSGRTNEIRIIKLWRNQKGLDFPSFYLELIVINALQGFNGTLTQNVVRVLEYLRDNFTNARVVDPANTNNVISDDLTATEKNNISSAAEKALKSSSWMEVVQ